MHLLRRKCHRAGLHPVKKRAIVAVARALRSIWTRATSLSLGVSRTNMRQAKRCDPIVSSMGTSSACNSAPAERTRNMSCCRKRRVECCIETSFASGDARTSGGALELQLYFINKNARCPSLLLLDPSKGEDSPTKNPRDNRKRYSTTRNNDY